MKNWIVLTASLLCMLSDIVAKEYKVASAAECTKAAAAVTAGDVIVIANGNYSGWEITLNSVGTALQPVIVRPETPGKVVFSGNVNNAVFLLTGSFTELAGLVFEGCTIVKGTGNAVLVELKTTDHLPGYRLHIYKEYGESTVHAHCSGIRQRQLQPG